MRRNGASRAGSAAVCSTAGWAVNILSAAGLLGSILVGSGVAGCASAPRASEAEQKGRIASEQEIAAAAEDAAKQLEQALKDREARLTANATDASSTDSAGPGDPDTRRRVRSQDTGSGATTPQTRDQNIAAPSDDVNATNSASVAAVAPPEVPEPEDPARQIRRLSKELSEWIERRGPADASSDDHTGRGVLSVPMALAAIEIATGGDSASGTSPGDADLSPAERRIFETSRQVMTELVRGVGASGDPVKASRVMADGAKTLREIGGVRVVKAALCRRVESFGRFDPLATSAFLAGRAHRAIVYVELDGFTSRPTREDELPGPGSVVDVIPRQSENDGTGLPTVDGGGSGGWAVEVSQELELIHDADGRQQWYQPPQKIVDASRSTRRDFYLVRTIELPATLSVGAYSLKVTVRDLTSGSTDECVIPIQVIADASALSSPRALSTR